MVHTNQPIFISIETTAFSGATLLAMLLGAHPDVTTIGEMSGLISRNHPETYLCSCGKKIKVCQFWQAVTIAMTKRGFEFDVAYFNTKFNRYGPLFMRRLREGSVRNSTIDSLRDKILYSLPNERRQIKAAVARNLALVEAVLEVTGKNVFVDSSKSRLRFKALYQFSPLDVRVIHLVRRAEGVVASQLRRNPGSNVSELAHDWRQRHRRLDVTLPTWPREKYIQVRYEDVCQDTENTLKRLFEFCGVDADIQHLDFRAETQHIIGNPMRLRPLSEIKLDERWKKELSSNQLAEIDRVAGDLNRRYKYPEFRAVLAAG
jgi:hypothetical protein